MNYVKPQKPLIQDGKGIYPLTTIDQVVRADGRRFSENEFNRVFQRNLLRPTLQTQTQNGVTCTNNGDGTYTLNGTATDWNAVFNVDLNDCIEYGKTYKIVGCPQGGGSGKYGLEITDQIVYGVADYRDGAIFSPYETGYRYKMLIVVYANQTVNNLVFKPMLTEDLNATYDDFVSFDDSVITGINSGIKMDLLWENASPTSAFAAQTISLDLSEYSMIGVVFLYEVPSNTNHSVLLTALVDGSTTLFQMGAQGDANNIRRFGTVSTTGIVWGSGGYSGTSNDNYARPIKIYGIK